MNATMDSSEDRPSAGSNVVSFSAMSFTPFLCETLCCPDVPVLASLVAAAEQHDDGFATLLEIDPVAGAMVDTQFAHAVPNRLHIARMAIGRPVESGENHAPCAVIAQL